MSKTPNFGHDSPELAGDLRTEAMVLDEEGYNGQRLRDGADHIEALEAEIARLRAQRDKAREALRMSQSVLAQFRDPDFTVSAANVYAQICEAEVKCRVALAEIEEDQ